ncbi:MAG TPA: DUF485 domain-containing protein [Pseudonocardiaceae bacterium]|jgi:uncharacterized membrane protein (DUF485 family)
MSTHDDGAQVPPSPSESRFVAVQQSSEFQDLRRRYRRWVLPVAAISLLWYFAYVILAAYAKGFMSVKIFGNVNVALIMGLLQFVTTFGVTALYIRFADKVLDPVTARMRDEIEGGV